MGRQAGILIAGLLLVGACSGGGSGAAAPTTTSASSALATTTTSTTAPTSPEAQVKAAYLAYWSMVDRLLESPDPGDPELATRAAEPLLSSIRDQIATTQAKGGRYSTPPDRSTIHDVQTVTLSDGEATVVDCFRDERVEYGPASEVVDSGISTRRAEATLVAAGERWLVSDLRFTNESPGVVPCTG